MDPGFSALNWYDVIVGMYQLCISYALQTEVLDLIRVPE